MIYKEQQEQKQFLKEQVEWCKQQDRILEQIESKLYEMRELAQYACCSKLTSMEANELNQRLNNLKNDVLLLEQHLHSAVH
ncbi:hypothetical protein RRU94_10880 [Domibacillus sp. DTU_2020_1001157_1_SI_ALB_TIR_016]|uniref:hypothetical protein n=1 Tax=Domibacillus sp. DTU_2020_1001157_1_SI_ALB_TIR_016 TaxID=3077789 RepID=UPI0028E68D27|nr:hypothetical protein [Domibacillus sp. DTU_2020_1001157_1_SI_ALB_TIR_016]WNS81303.1 hypothetical protein RRU94_10880 [Domibacillus sp. DTU_2020_1001157_1_SI_ALB_TIR_016]